MINYRNYKGRIRIPKEFNKYPTSKIGEKLFKMWFEKVYEDEKIILQKADRDLQGIDAVDEKGFTYQIKTTTKCSYTFNHPKEDIENISKHLRAHFYVLIQLNPEDEKDVAYIEGIYDAKEIKDRMKESYQYNNCFIWKDDLKQYQLEMSL